MEDELWKSTFAYWRIFCEADHGVGCNSAIIYYPGSVWLIIHKVVNLQFNTFSGVVSDLGAFSVFIWL